MEKKLKLKWSEEQWLRAGWKTRRTNSGRLIILGARTSHSPVTHHNGGNRVYCNGKIYIPRYFEEQRILCSPGLHMYKSHSTCNEHQCTPGISVATLASDAYTSDGRYSYKLRTRMLFVAGGKRNWDKCLDMIEEYLEDKKSAKIIIV